MSISSDFVVYIALSLKWKNAKQFSHCTSSMQKRAKIFVREITYCNTGNKACKNHVFVPLPFLWRHTNCTVHLWTAKVLFLTSKCTSMYWWPDPARVWNSIPRVANVAYTTGHGEHRLTARWICTILSTSSSSSTSSLAIVASVQSGLISFCLLSTSCPRRRRRWRRRRQSWSEPGTTLSPDYCETWAWESSHTDTPAVTVLQQTHTPVSEYGLTSRSTH